MEGLNTSLKTMSNYMTNEGNEKFDVNKLKSQILYWSQNMETVRIDCNKYESIMKIVDKKTTLFNLREEIKIEELQRFFVNILQPIIGEKRTTRQTGINLFDNKNEPGDLRKKDESKENEKENNIEEELRNEEAFYDCGNKNDIIRRIYIFEDDE